MKAYNKKIKVVDISDSKKDTPIENTICRYNGNRIIDDINNWFNKGKDGDIPPIHTVQEIAKKFRRHLEECNLSLTMNFASFFSKLCRATCTLALRRTDTKISELSYNIPPPPKDWSQEIEIIWNDYIESFYLNTDFWDSFWSTIETGIWELSLPHFRNYLQSILPLFIKRDLRLLIDSDLVAENSEGKYVDIYDAELDMVDEYEDE
jgi:hypothetical protein